MGARSSNNNKGLNHISDGHLLEYFRNTFIRGGGGTNPPPPPEGLTATGGVISDYNTPPGAVYRAHIFTSSGTFNVTAPGTFGDTVEYLVVAGGGGGGSEGSQRGGGGGAGGFRTNVPGTPGDHTTTVTFPVSVSPYPVVIGAGGAGGSGGQGSDGVDSSFGPITSNGGGGGGQGSQDSPPANEGRPGGSGGGGGSTAGPSATEPGGSTIAVTTPSPWPGPSTQGFAGGTGQHLSGSWAGGGGGGGAGGAGGDATNSPPGGTGTGGIGIRSLIAGPGPTGAGAIGTPGPGSTTGGWFAGGGAGVFFTGGPVGPAAGGGGIADYPNQPFTLRSGVYATGGGGASASIGGSGGSGIVVVRYQIAQLTATQKATGGAISYYGGKTIHTFTSSGTFATEPNWTGETIEYVVIGGGGSGGPGPSDNPGGGGAGAYRTGTTPIGAHPVSTTIQVGAGGIQSDGTPSYFGAPITSPGGGAGGANGSAGNPGGSGGGGGYKTYAGGSATGAPFPGTIGATPSAGWGHNGATANGDPPRYAAGGGGGAGGAGDSTTTSAYGGFGMQLPTTFRDPASSVGHPGPTSGPSCPVPGGFDTSGKYWFAGGGGGGFDGPNGIPIAAGGGPGGPYAGAGPAGDGAVAPGVGVPAKENSGSGGGGNSQPVSGSSTSSGGSGIVLIAYPS